MLENWNDIETKFPNIKIFFMSQPDRAYYSCITQAHKEQKWPFLGTISQPTDTTCMEACDDCLLECRNNMSSLLLLDDGTNDLLCFMINYMISLILFLT